MSEEEKVIAIFKKVKDKYYIQAPQRQCKQIRWAIDEATRIIKKNEETKNKQKESLAYIREIMCDRYCMYSRSNTINQEELDEHCDNCEMVEEMSKMWNLINNNQEEE